VRSDTQGDDPGLSSKRFQRWGRNVKTDNERTLLQRQIAATDRQIDQLVYELYGLTDEEVRIVEEGG
jgi:hypothetical protein